MMEWNPIMSTPDDVKAIFGQPTSETENSLEYRFDSGHDGVVWKFTIEGGDLVTGVQWIPME